MSKDNPHATPDNDLLIAQSATLKPIEDIAARLGLTRDDIEPYGRFKAKIPLETVDSWPSSDRSQSGDEAPTR